MIQGYFTMLVALTISAIAEYYSIIGLTAIFSASFWPIVIMGASLGVGKLTAAIWLKVNWERSSWTYKLYLVPAVAFLMLLTSMGIFGFLSKAHSDQGLVSGDSQAKVAIYDEKIRTAKDNIEANRKALRQLDEAVDQVMVRSTDEKGADKAVAIRRSQQKERGKLLAEIDAEQKKIVSLNEEAAPLRAEFRKIENEVGPIKYIAALIYGDDPDANLLESAVRWVIILIVAVFDPLALVLILAAQQSLRWAKEDKDKITLADRIVPEDTTVENEQPTEIIETNYHATGWMFTRSDEDKATEAATQQQPEESILEKHPYLTKTFDPKDHFAASTPMVYQPEEIKSQEPVPVVEETNPVYVAEVTMPDPIPDVERLDNYLVPEEKSKFPKVPETAARVKAEVVSVPEALNVRKSSGPVADNIKSKQSHSDFGTTFPATATKGDMFLRVDYLPNKLFKFNGQKWIEVDKSKTDSYTYDEQYILFLIEKLQSGEYDLDQ
jgi:hypothetical protein